MEIETDSLFLHHETTPARHVYCTWCNIYIRILKKKNEHETDSFYVRVRTVQSVKLIIAIAHFRNNHDVCLMFGGGEGIYWNV